ncbi:hypothetical protein ACH4VX_02915 [Streptomyces sp. NPDC020731]|uniref:hypothetical protein n=1 Tax=Streptomyces sp. NPDC020731 TaxID=3365085 RepID=UPI0037901888
MQDTRPPFFPENDGRGGVLPSGTWTVRFQGSSASRTTVAVPSGVTPEIPTPGRWTFRHPGEVIQGGKAEERPVEGGERDPPESRRLFRAGDDTVIRFRFVDEHRTAHKVKRMCDVLGWDRSGY